MVWKRLLAVLFPARCVSCSAPGGWWCPACSRRVVRIEDPLLARGLDGLLAGAEHRNPLTHLIKALKYRHAKAAAPIAAAYPHRLVSGLREKDPLLVPVPLHPRRLRERGYNQSTLLAEALSESTTLPLSTALVRVRHTRSQTGLGRISRRENVQGAFRWTGAPLAGRTVVLVDDVYTTGATLESCAGACRKAGARHVWGAVVGKR